MSQKQCSSSAPQKRKRKEEVGARQTRRRLNLSVEKFFNESKLEALESQR